MSYIPKMQIITRVAGYIRQGYFITIYHCRIYPTSIFTSYLPLSYTYDKHISFLFANVVYIRHAFFIPICQCVYIRHNRSLSAIFDKIHLARNLTRLWRVVNYLQKRSNKPVFFKSQCDLSKQ